MALQLWLLLSFLVDALAVAAQTLVADELGKGSVIKLYYTLFYTLYYTIYYTHCRILWPISLVRVRVRVRVCVRVRVHVRVRVRVRVSVRVRVRERDLVHQ